MIVTVLPSIISGTVYAPASKSSMQRACALALLHEGETTIINPGKSNDDLAAMNIIKHLGAEINKLPSGDLIIESNNFPESFQVSTPGGDLEGVLNCGESGLGIRMFAPIAALSSNEITINGEGSLLNRPMHFFDDIFPQLGISIQTNNGHLPLRIKGPLQPADISIDGSLSSQFLTGLLMAYGKAAIKPVTITVQNLKSKPYIDLTLQMMKQFGYHVTNINYEQFVIYPSFDPSTPLRAAQDLHNDPSTLRLRSGLIRTYTVEGDWSAAAFLLVAGAIAGGITVNGLNVFSAQADKAILKALMDCGCNISIEEKQIVINSPLGNARGKPFHFNATDCPDLFPPLVALAAYCDGTTVIEGVNRLHHKESDRALTLKEEFNKMGVEITLQDDLMMIRGGEDLKGAIVHSHHDHRIAMACAVSALKANGETIIKEAEAVNKSYPDFYEDLILLGANVTLPK